MMVNYEALQRLYERDKWITIPDCARCIVDMNNTDDAGFTGKQKNQSAVDSLRRKIQEDLQKSCYTPYQGTGTGRIGHYYRIEDVADVVSKGNYTRQKYLPASLIFEFSRIAKTSSEIERLIK